MGVSSAIWLVSAVSMSLFMFFVLWLGTDWLLLTLTSASIVPRYTTAPASPPCAWSCW